MFSYKKLSFRSLGEVSRAKTRSKIGLFCGSFGHV